MLLSQSDLLPTPSKVLWHLATYLFIYFLLSIENKDINGNHLLLGMPLSVHFCYTITKERGATGRFTHFIHTFVAYSLLTEGQEGCKGALLYHRPPGLIIICVYIAAVKGEGEREEGPGPQ